ncbi:MAG: carboxymuconolactone decarboxylase family protein [Dermatophilaceae bacterium]
MSRLERLVPERLDEQQQVLYEQIIGGPRSSGPQAFRLVGADGALEGPFNAMLLCPAVGTALQALGAAVRYSTSLSDRAREMAILAVAAHEDSAFEWHAHEAVGRLAGLTGADFAAIRAGLAPAGATDEERAVVDATLHLLHDGDLEDQAFQTVLAHLHPVGLQELMTLVGYYRMLALQLRVFRVGTPT